MRTLDQVIKYASAQVQRQASAQEQKCSNLVDQILASKQEHKHTSAYSWPSTCTCKYARTQVQRHLGKQAQKYTSAHTWLTTRPLIFRHHPHLTSHSAGLNIDSSWLPLGGSCRIQKFEGINDCLIKANMTKGRRGFSHVFYISWLLHLTWWVWEESKSQKELVTDISR